MRKLALLSGLFVVLSHLPAHAQDPAQTEKKGAGFVFAAPSAIVSSGKSVAMFHFGGGGDALVHHGWGVTMDLGYAFFTGGGISQGIGLFSPGVIYKFNRERRTVPFVVGGYTAAFRNGAHGLLHFGGGLEHWMRDRWGLRFEGRSFLDPSQPSYNLLQFRIGLVFR